MIGTRGVRLGILRRGLYEMQVRALCNAATQLFEAGKHPRVEIMIPLVVDAEELRIARQWVTNVFDEIGHPELAVGVVAVGAMIETPRAALTAAALADHADFFSLGTNDLTQMTYAFSRDDVEARLLPAYLAEGIFSANPFVELDPVGVGALVRMACDAARAAKPGIGIGVCGEHAGDPASIEFLVGLGVDSVSCSPYRLPIARLAVARALLACGRVRVADLTFDYAPERAPAVPTAPDHGTPALEVDEGFVLHVLRIRGLAGPGGLVDSLGTHPADLLDALVDAGLVRHVEARDLFGLLPAGRERQEQLLAEYAPEPLRRRLAPDYERFLVLNAAFKPLCHDWQLREGLPNDHADGAYDRACIERLVAVAADLRPALGSMVVTLPRLARYGARLQGAVDAVVGGDTHRFTGVMCESFHDIWMELHEDLVVLLGIDRAEEGSF
jgi:hypothetical protein